MILNFGAVDNENSQSVPTISFNDDEGNEKIIFACTTHAFPDDKTASDFCVMIHAMLAEALKGKGYFTPEGMDPKEMAILMRNDKIKKESSFFKRLFGFE